MHGVAARQRIQALGELPQRPELLCLSGELPQLRQLDQGGADVPGPDVRKALGELADDLRRNPDSEAGVPQCVPGPVRLGHAGDRGPLPPEPLNDRVVHLQAPLGLHIEVDVRQRRAALAQEPLFTDRRAHRDALNLGRCVAVVSGMACFLLGCRAAGRHPEPRGHPASRHARTVTPGCTLRTDYVINSMCGCSGSAGQTNRCCR